LKKRNRRHWLRLFAPVLAGMAAATPPAFAQSTEPPAALLTIHVTGLTTTIGPVMLALFDTEAAYRDGKSAPRSVSFNPTRGPLEFTLTLPTGRYAIKAYHDINGNGRLDTNLFGIPTEPVAFSNNAALHMGPPAWPEASFEVHTGDNLQTIMLHVAHRAAGSILFQGVGVQDWASERSRTFDFGRGHLVEEMVFVPRPGDARESSGWIVGPTINLHEAATELHVFDAAHVDLGPLCTWRAPLALPVGFHGVFAS
jgi:uncharacterized protein (DUF2141 family)